MNKKIQWLIGIVAVFALCLAAYGLVRNNQSAPQVVENTQPFGGITNYDTVSATSMQVGTGCNLGQNCVAMVTDTNSGNNATTNGEKQFARQIFSTTATNTPLAIQAPSTGTTTATVGCTVTGTATTTTSQVTLSRSATAFATTTLLASLTIGSLGQGTFVATTTPVGPSQWLVVGFQGGAGGFTPTGGCTAEFTTTI